MRGWIIRYGDSEGYEISKIKEVAEQTNIELTFVDPKNADIIVTRDKKNIILDGVTATVPDFCWVKTGSGTNYFTLALVRQLERAGVICINGSHAIETVKDKLFAHQILAENDVPTPKTMLVRFPFTNFDLVEKYLKYPVVVKTLSGSFGSGVFLSQDKRELSTLLGLVGGTNPKANIILQEFKEASNGKDIRVLVLGGMIVGAMERTSGDGDFRANISRGGTAKKIDIPRDAQWIALKTASVLGLKFTGIDLLYSDNNGFAVCEANSNPGFEGFESCHDFSVPTTVFDYIKTLHS